MFQEGYFDKVYYRFYKSEPQNEIRANLFAIHGLGGHCIWFDSAAKLFNKNKINFFSFDLPAFGQSKYPKGQIESYKLWITTTRRILERFLFSFEIKKPVFILGHSMGALIAALLAKSVKANGWIISVPGFKGNNETWPMGNFILPVLFKSIFSPYENIVMPFGPELLTKNKDTQLKVKKDQLRVVNVSAQIFKHVYFLTLKAKLSYKFFNDPVLMLIAGKDKICSKAAMEEYFEHIKSKDKSKKIYTNSYHDLFIEDELNQIVDDISEWIKQKSAI